MGATQKNITTVYYNNSKTGTTIASTAVDSEMIQSVKNISGDTRNDEVAANKEVNPGVVGGTTHQN